MEVASRERVIDRQPERDFTNSDSSGPNCFQACGVLVRELYKDANTRSRERFLPLERNHAVKNGFTAGLDETGCVQKLFFDAFGANGSLDYQLAVYEQRDSYECFDRTEECLLAACCLPVQLMRRIGNCVAHCGFWLAHAREPFCEARAKFYVCAICGECAAFPIEIAQTVTKVSCIAGSCCCPGVIGPTKPFDSCPECLDRVSLFKDLTRRVEYPKEQFVSTQIKTIIQNRTQKVSLLDKEKKRVPEGKDKKIEEHLERPPIVLQPVAIVEGPGGIEVGVALAALALPVVSKEKSPSNDQSSSSLTLVQRVALKAVGSSISVRSKGASSEDDRGELKTPGMSRNSSGLQLTLKGRRQRSGSSIGSNGPVMTSGGVASAPTTRAPTPLMNLPNSSIQIYGVMITTV